MIRQVLGGSSTSLDSSTIEVGVPISDYEENFEHQRQRYSVNSDDLDFPDFDWECDGSAKCSDSTGVRRRSLSPRHVKKHAYNGASSRGSPPVRQGSPGRSPLVHSHTVDHKRKPFEDKNLHPMSASLSRLDDKKRSSIGSDSLRVPSSVAVDTRTMAMSDQSQSENGASASAKRRGLQQAHEVRTPDIE